MSNIDQQVAFQVVDESDEPACPLGDRLLDVEEAVADGSGDYQYSDTAQRKNYLMDIEKKMKLISESFEIDIHIDLHQSGEDYELDRHIDDYVRCHRVLAIIRRELAALN